LRLRLRHIFKMAPSMKIENFRISLCIHFILKVMTVNKNLGSLADMI
jgi:hypothetical protein